MVHNVDSFKDFLVEGPRIRRIRLRFRGGKIQRNVRVSGVKGYRMTRGRLVRMSSSEKLHRRMGARRGKIKRRAKMARIRMKRARTMRRRHAMGF